MTFRWNKIQYPHIISDQETLPHLSRSEIAKHIEELKLLHTGHLRGHWFLRALTIGPALIVFSISPLLSLVFLVPFAIAEISFFIKRKKAKEIEETIQSDMQYLELKAKDL